jgi:hypothetical protein
MHFSKNPQINQAPYFMDIREGDRIGWRSRPAGDKIRGSAQAAPVLFRVVHDSTETA